jgi:photoactive yellow protein
MSFVPEEFIKKLGSLTREEADQQPFGIVKLDETGKVTLYNKYEAELGKVAVEEAEGKNFFQQVAPCTNNKLFKGKFEKGIGGGDLDVKFNYTFTYKLRPTNVAVHMYMDQMSKTNWVFVQRR